MNRAINQRQYFAYIDESGDLNLSVEKSGTSDFYISVAIMVDDTQQDDLRRGIAEIQKSHFGGGEMKSANVGKRDKRRTAILEDILNLDFGFYASIVDKTRVDSESGLKWKQSFYKYFAGRLNKRLFEGMSELHVVTDRHGTEGFQDSVLAYLNKKIEGDLFRRYWPEYKSPSEESILQLADFVAGTFLRAYSDTDGNFIKEQTFRRLIKKKGTHVSSWPPEHWHDSEREDTSEWDDVIRESNLTQCRSFLSENGGVSEGDKAAQVAALSLLMQHRRFERKDLHAREIIENLARQGFADISEKQPLSSRIISPLRDYGIVITSSVSGYCLSLSTSDIHRHFDHISSKVVPMIKRLERARELVRKATSNRFDPLELPENRILQAFCDALKTQPPEEK